MKEIILIKNGELALKGLNRSTFEDILIKNIKRRLKDLGAVTVRKAQSAIYIEPQDESFDFVLVDRDQNVWLSDGAKEIFTPNEKAVDLEKLIREKYQE